MRVVIAGPRSLPLSIEMVTAAVNASGFDVLEVVSGAAKGVDYSAERWAIHYNFGLKQFFPKWGKHGLSAGPIRNRDMAEYADALIVIKRPGPATSGTASMIREAEKRGLPIHVEEVS